jgi:hypothetical protein
LAVVFEVGFEFRIETLPKAGNGYAVAFFLVAFSWRSKKK